MTQAICRLEELGQQQCREFEFQHGEEVVAAFVLRLGDKVVGYRNHCPHTGAPLNWTADEFLSFDHEFIQCAIHGALFHLQDGLCVHGPCLGRSLHRVELIVSDGVVSLSDG